MTSTMSNCCHSLVGWPHPELTALRDDLDRCLEKLDWLGLSLPSCHLSMAIALLEETCGCGMDATNLATWDSRPSRTLHPQH